MSEVNAREFFGSRCDEVVFEQTFLYHRLETEEDCSEKVDDPLFSLTHASIKLVELEVSRE